MCDWYTFLFPSSDGIDKGRLYAWGNNESGQLGVGDTKNREVPTVVEFFEGKRIVAVSGGETHTIVQVEE